MTDLIQNSLILRDLQKKKNTQHVLKNICYIISWIWTGEKVRESCRSRNNAYAEKLRRGRKNRRWYSWERAVSSLLIPINPQPGHWSSAKSSPALQARAAIAAASARTAGRALAGLPLRGESGSKEPKKVPRDRIEMMK